MSEHSGARVLFAAGVDRGSVRCDVRIIGDFRARSGQFCVCGRVGVGRHVPQSTGVLLNFICCEARRGGG